MLLFLDLLAQVKEERNGKATIQHEIQQFLTFRFALMIEISETTANYICENSRNTRKLETNEESEKSEKTRLRQAKHTKRVRQKLGKYVSFSQRAKSAEKSSRWMKRTNSVVNK